VGSSTNMPRSHKVHEFSAPTSRSDRHGFASAPASHLWSVRPSASRAPATVATGARTPLQRLATGLAPPRATPTGRRRRRGHPAPPSRQPAPARERKPADPQPTKQRHAIFDDQLVSPPPAPAACPAEPAAQWAPTGRPPTRHQDLPRPQRVRKRENGGKPGPAEPVNGVGGWAVALSHAGQPAIGTRNGESLANKSRPPGPKYSLLLETCDWRETGSPNHIIWIRW
jgi:hypothetical protein